MKSLCALKVLFISKNFLIALSTLLAILGDVDLVRRRGCGRGSGVSSRGDMVIRDQ